MLRDRILNILSRAIGAQQILEGTPYARYAVPIDYHPSRDFRPRYGYSHPPIRSLEDWFTSCADEYREFVRHMRTLDVSHIALSSTSTEALKPAWIGGPISAFDALALYAMVRKNRPKRYLEIGSGMTTRFARQAISDTGQATRIVSIDPDPRSAIDGICDEVIRDGLETCELAVFDDLEPGDIVFLDGSHRTFMNSDVTVFFIDVLPRLRPGVIVHIHDIFLPYDYPESFKNWYWNEQYMLAVYMMGNRHRIRPLLPTAFICKSPLFEQDLRLPFVELGPGSYSWREGGSMWFTHE